MEKYRVVWDQEYNGSDHDEYLTGPLSREEANAFCQKWAEDKVDKMFPAGNIDEFFRSAVFAKRAELSYLPVENEPEPAITMPMKEGWVDILEEALRKRRRQAEDTLANGFGNRDYILDEIKGYSALLRCITYAKQKGCNRATLVFEKVEGNG